MSNKTSKRLDLNTSELRKGDVVHAHGMEIYLDDEPKTWTSRNAGEAEPCTVYAFKGRVINLREFRESSWARVIPMSWLMDDETKRNNVWTIQGNHLARWSVEREG